MKAYQVTVTDTATLLVAADNIHRAIWLHNNTNHTLYIGGSDVSVAQGFPTLKHSAPVERVLGVGDTLYGIAQAGQSIDVRLLIPPVD